MTEAKRVEPEKRIAELEQRVEGLTYLVGVIAQQVAESPVEPTPANDGRTRLRLVRAATRQEVRSDINRIVKQAGLHGLEFRVL